MSRLTFNLNQRIYAKLTPDGERQLRDHYAAECRMAGVDGKGYARMIDMHCTTRDGEWTFSLWQFMEIFGPNMHIGMNLISENNTIEMRLEQ
jgi:hypothetical protein